MIEPRRVCRVWFLGFWALWGCAPATRTASDLPVANLETTHVNLYDCGLAQVERQAFVEGEMRLPIQTTTAHLDDLAASLIVASDKDVRVTGVEYESTQNLMQAVSASGFATAMISEENGYQKPVDFAGYARALVGTEVVVVNADKTEIKGTVIDCVENVASRPQSQNGMSAAYDAPDSSQPSRPDKILVLAGQSGALIPIPLDTVTRIAPVSKREAEALHNFATQLGRTGGYTETEVNLTTAPKSSGKLAVSYIRQSPLWRTLYRITTYSDGAVLEAWAVVHNDTGEDWRNVSMTLIAGMPYSYVMSVASPRYKHRESLLLDDENASMTQQLGAVTPDGMLYPSQLVGIKSGLFGDQIGDAFGYGGLGLSGTGRGGGGTGSGISLHSIGHLNRLEEASSLLAVGAPAAEVQTKAETIGDISTYTAMSLVTIRAGASAMVPILRKKMPGEAFSLISQEEDSTKTCVRAVNSTGLVLQDGAASVYADGRFRGQLEIERVEPGETRIWCFGEDRDVSFEVKEDATWQHRALEWKDETLYVHGIKTTKYEYTVDNNAGLSRRLAIAISRNQNGRFLTNDPMIASEFDTSFLLMLDVKRRSETVKTVAKEEGVMKAVSLEETHLAKLLDEKEIDDAQREILTAALEKSRESVDIDAEIAACTDRIETSGETVKRLRNNLQSVPKLEGSSAIADEILRQIMSEEESIAAEQVTLKALQESKKPVSDEVAVILSAISPAATASTNREQ